MQEPSVLRVCLLSREYPPETAWGGIATFTRHLALGLKELGHEVEVVCLSAGAAKCALQEGILVHRVTPFFKEGELGLTGTFMPKFRHLMSTAPALWLKFLERHREKSFDIIDAPDLLADGLMASITRIAPLVVRLYTPHSKFIADRLNSTGNSFDHQAVAATERLAMLQADVLTSPSLDLAKHIAADLNCPLGRIRIVSNPIDVHEFSPESSSSESTSADESLAVDNSQTVLFVGRLEERKGIEILVEAIPIVCRELPTARFLIVGADTNYGQGSQSMLKRLKKSLVQSGISEKVVFRPPVPLQELPALYRAASICVVPSVYDNSPYSCLEAMACGKAVITSDSGGAKEYLEHGISGLVIPTRDVHALAKAIIALLQDGSRREQLGLNARQRVLKHFQRRTIAQRTLELYDEARRLFHNQPRAPLYGRDPAAAANDLRDICESLEASLYEMLYRVSYRHRFFHWLRLAGKRPRLFLAKTGVKLMQACGVSRILPKQCERLEELISRQNKISS